MRLILFLIGAVAGGVCLGLAPSYARFGWVWNPPPALFSRLGTASIRDALAPRVKLHETQHDFGYIEHDARVEHDFRVENVGRSPLHLEIKGVSCVKCTEVAPLKKNVLQPGEQTLITVRYRADRSDQKFRQSGIISSDDPSMEQFNLTVSGQIIQSFEFVPSRLTLSQISVNATPSFEVQLLARKQATLEVMKTEFSNSQMAEHCDVTVEPLDPKVIAEAKALAGLLLRFQIKPGLPVGPLPTQELRVTTNLDSQAVIELPIQGAIVGDFTLLGPGCRRDVNQVDLGTIEQKEGFERELRLITRGELKSTVQFEVESVTPAYLEVSLGETKWANTFASTPIKIKIPPNSPIESYAGGTQFPAAKIVLKTNHPQMPRLELQALFNIQK